MPESKPLPKRAAVIGSGFGGLGAAIRLQSAGIPTVLYEARDLPGGRAYVYHDDGYTFDAGPTVITAPHTLTDLFELSGKKLEVPIKKLLLGSDPKTVVNRESMANPSSFEFFVTYSKNQTAKV